MTDYGFDLDGTLTHPHIRDLANALYDTGHNVHVITGGLNEKPPWDLATRVKYLYELGVRYTKLHRCIAPTWEEIAVIKGDVCKHENVTLMLDDMPVFLSGIKAGSPSTIGLLVLG